ncbi:MAG TPA: proprotein convertase P-domain-containing protein [Thermoanaerobaculia bacterium]|nr:proprotein convertase P-domain-containing protein [Thermoanaerobaculia bacterium]
MNVNVRRFAAVALFAAGVTAVLPGTAAAQMVKGKAEALDALSVRSDRLNVSGGIDSIDALSSALAPTVNNSWNQFRASHGEWTAAIDSRNGLIASAEGAGIPWVPGRGNRLTKADIASLLGGRNKPDLTVLESIARNFVAKNGKLIGVDPASLVLNSGRSGQPSDYLWFVDFDVVRAGIPVEGARVVFRVNHGNLIQWGTEYVPAQDVAVPPVKIGYKAALASLSSYVGGLSPLTDRILENGKLHLIPTLRQDAGFGKGYELANVYQFTFHRQGVMGTWRAKIDAFSGELLEFADVNDYAQASGGIYQNSPTTGAEIVRPMPFTNLSTGGFTNSGGVFAGGSPTSSLQGQFVRITDTCGAISLATNGSGDLAFGTSAGTNCTTPGVGGAGNTHSSREQFYQVNRIKEVAKGWLPSNVWLGQQLLVNVNLNQTCNAYWNGSSLNFFRSGGGCNNTGELAGVSLHEFGHGIDQNDGTGSASEGGTGESYGDTTAVIALHASCIGPGFLASNCAGYGDACTACTGVRDVDFAKHVSNTAATVSNFTQVRCGAGSGPCGKEVHCESYVPSEAIWDFANRDLPGPGLGPAWTTLDRLWYLSRSTATSSFSCTTGGTFTSNGCNAGSWWKTMRAVDDDDGNLANGTPHGGALFAAFNRHGIACTTDAGASTTFRGCTSPTTPTLTLAAGSNSAAVSWTSSGAGVVYDVFRNETGCNAGFTKVANDVSATSYADNVVANNFTYYYQVTAHPTGNESCAGAPSTCLSVIPVPVACTPPAAPTGVTATATGQTTATVSWTASAGATGYNILRSTTSGGPYTLVGTSATTSFADTGLTCNTSYFYVVQATNAPGCASANSAQATATTDACPVGGNQVLTFSASPALAIPDNNTTGVTSTINVAAGQTVTSVSVTVGITHTFQGDLEVALIGPDNTTVLLHNRTGAGTDNINTTYAIVTVPAQALTAFTGKNTAGAWKLRVRDLAAVDVGTLNSWKITFNGYSTATPALAIPDNNTTGITSTINVAATGTVTSLSVRVGITHTFQGDLEVALIGPDNTTVLLHNRTGGTTDNINTVYADLTVPAQALSAFVGKATNGAWKLRVRDLAAVDVGTLNSWALDLH